MKLNYFCNECKNGSGCLIGADINNPDDTWQFSDSGCDMIQGGFAKRPIWILEKSTIGDNNYAISIVRLQKSKPMKKKKYSLDD